MLYPVAIHSDAGPIVEDGQLDFTDATATPVVPGITTAPDGAYVDIAWQVVSTADGTVFNLTDEAGHSVLTAFGGGQVILQALPGRAVTIADGSGHTVVQVGGTDNTLGFFGTGPVAQPAAPVTLGDVIAALKALGLVAT